MRTLTAALGAAFLAFSVAGAAAQGAFSDGINTKAEVDAATSMVNDWLDGKIESPYKVNYTGPKVKLRYTSHLPAVALPEKVVMRAFEQLARDTNNAFQVETYHAQSLHPHREGITSVRDGIADIASCFSIFDGASFNMMHAIALPGGLGSSPSASLIYTELWSKYFKKEYEDFGGVYTWRVLIPPIYQTIGKHGYEKLDDWKGSKVRISGRQQTAAMKLLGAAPSTIPAQEAYTALQRGIVDSVMLNDSIFRSFKLHEVSTIHSDTALFSVNLEYCMNKQWFDGLAPELKKAIYHFGQIVTQAVAQIGYERGVVYAREHFKEKGIKFVKPTDEERNTWLEIMSPVEKEWIEKTEAKGLPARELLADLKALRAKYDQMSYNDIFKHVLENPAKGIIEGF